MCLATAVSSDSSIQAFSRNAICFRFKAARPEYPTGVPPFIIIRGDIPVTSMIAFWIGTATS